ncbi:Psf2-domain-containing protein [Schizopora paradoxa]|uniref:DNA replication complex GINS protein PSF2 n=1 Tax=Schizopora paradoxa TaxID=27342 RepID=A0A0H2RXK7_9AGAM|nr:Psf2-domain-containing protein [Schizopora paradoxa]
MAFPQSMRSSTTPQELEFIASEELVEIRPTVKMDQIRFISGIYGPFTGGRLVKVPLWMAVNLKLKKKCNVVPPVWLNLEYLQDKLSEETSRPVFSDLPFRYAEISKVLLDIASDDLDQPDKLRSVLKDLREARQAKTREGLRAIDQNALSLPNLSAMEINEARPFFVGAMGILSQLTATTDATTI